MPAAKTMVAHGDAMKCRERCRGDIFKRIRLGLLGREIGCQDQAETVDEKLLFLRAAAHQAAIFELGASHGPEQAGFGS